MNQFFQTQACIKCRGRGFCGKPCKIYSKIKDFTPKTKKHFSGSSPPEIFVGRYNYPSIQAGILSPEIIENTEVMGMPELWHKKKLSIDNILSKRGQLIYGKFGTQIKQTKVKKTKFTELMQEIGMAYKSVSTEFFLKKKPKQTLELNKMSATIGNPAPLEHARLQENPKIKAKVNYLVTDTDVKSANAMKELHKHKISTSNIIKILSAGLLGKKTARRLVPTRWAITATDDTLSKNLLKKIKYYPEINEIQLFHGYYIGNHYEILLLPDKFSFEVIEAYFSGSAWNQTQKLSIAQDYEFYHGRKKYAFNVTGAYYTTKLAIAEYFEKIKRQASVFIMREERPEYYAPLGVGILRELCREALTKPPEKFNTIQEALAKARTRLKLPISTFTSISKILPEYKKQSRLTQWF